MLFTCLLAGCSLQPMDWVPVKGENLTGRSDIPSLDPNDPNGPFVIENKTEEGQFSNITMKARIRLDEICRIKYLWPDHSITGRMVVKGGLGSKGKKYPIVLDTGCPVTCIVTDKHVINNRLPVYHLGTNPIYGADTGLCRLPELNIGKIVMTDLPCLYIEKREALQIFGVTIAYDESILLGLEILRAFKYVMFDDLNKEIEFSPTKIFEPAHPEQWKSFLFSIKEKSNNNSALFAAMTVEGEQLELMLDTGSGGWLEFNEQTWEKLRVKFPAVRLRNGSCGTAFLENFPCKKGIIKELEIGGKIFKNAGITVFQNENPINRKTLIGMKCFQDTIMVLDFERNLLWVKTNGTD